MRSIAAAFFGMTTDRSVFIPAVVMLWRAFLIGSLFLDRLSQDLWRTP
ncbi:MAG: hypothetical protein M0042_11550 [Nitrospiraceae bacterium]|nr:hypothetical protein [Nitrospiraceae bacterium]